VILLPPAPVVRAPVPLSASAAPGWILSESCGLERFPIGLDRSGEGEGSEGGHGEGRAGAVELGPAAQERLGALGIVLEARGPGP